MLAVEVIIAWLGKGIKWGTEIRQMRDLGLR